MQIARFAFAFALIACGGSSGTTPMPDAALDAPPGALCTGKVYDPCTSNDQCMSMNCHLYQAQGLQVCTQACSASVPCPNDSAGSAVACNQMGNCRPGAANACHR